MSRPRGHNVLQDVSIEGGPGALVLLRDADTGCLRLTCLRLDLDLSLRFAIGVWTASVTHKPYALQWVKKPSRCFNVLKRLAY